MTTRCRWFFPNRPFVRTIRSPMKSGRRRLLIACVASAAATAVGVSVAGAATGDVVQARGVQLDLPDGWATVTPAREPALAEPRTLLVIGTDGVKAVDSECRVASYRVPADGAVVVVIGWRDSVGGASYLPLSGLKLRRGTFDCYPGRGAVARVTRRDRDFQISVMVGDRARPGTVDAALEAARSLALASRS